MQRHKGYQCVQALASILSESWAYETIPRPYELEASQSDGLDRSLKPRHLLGKLGGSSRAPSFQYSQPSATIVVHSTVFADALLRRLQRTAGSSKGEVGEERPLIAAVLAILEMPQHFVSVYVRRVLSLGKPRVLPVFIVQDMYLYIYAMTRMFR